MEQNLIGRPKQNRVSTKKARQFRYTLTLTLMALPGIISLIIFNYLPMAGVVIAFKRYIPRKGIFGSPWVGLENFEFFFSSQDAARTIRNTVLYSAGFLILDLILGVLIAVLLYNLKKATHVKVYHTIILLPKFLSIVIVSFIVYALLSPSYGAINQIIVALGGTKVQWYTEPEYWPAILTIVHAWMTIGGGCLYYYAALTGLDPALLESADLEGASSVQKAWYIMIPELVPIMVMMTVLGIGHLFGGDMGLFYQVPKDQGVLYPVTDTISTYTYRALLDGSMSRSAAVGLFQSAVGLVLVVTTNAIVRKISPENAIF